MPPPLSQRERAPRWALRAGLFLGGWTLVALLYAAQFYYTSSKAGRSHSFAQALTWSLADWYAFAVLSIPAIWLARRFPFYKGRWGAVFLAHVSFSALFSLAYMALRAALTKWEALSGLSNVSFSAAFQELFKTFPFNIWIYAIVVSITQVVSFYRELHARELRTRELEAGLAQARLHALQMQLNPHFLFNTLHTISALVHKDADAADDMISHLSVLLRQALESTGSHEVRLRDEIEFLKKYLHIEQTRFGDRLTVHWKIAPDTLDAYVPNLALQPVIENAIRHGIEPHARPGVIEIEADRSGGALELRVRDNGAGLRNGPIQEGVGLSNTRARLEQLYGARSRFEYSNGPNGGLEVRLVLPYQCTKILEPQAA